MGNPNVRRTSHTYDGDTRPAIDWQPRGSLGGSQGPPQSSWYVDTHHRSDHQGYDDRSNHRGYDVRTDHRGYDSRSDHRGYDDRSNHRGYDDRSDHRGYDARTDHRGYDVRTDHRGYDDRTNHRGYDVRTDHRRYDDRMSPRRALPPPPPRSPPPPRQNHGNKRKRVPTPEPAQPPKQPRLYGVIDPSPLPPGTPALPANRDDIWCGLCQRNHGDPRFCRNHSRGKLDMCVRCGRTDHLFEKCWYGDARVDDRAFFLYDCRIGLGPVVTTLDCTDLVAVPGVHTRDVLTREETRAIYNNKDRPYFSVPAKHLDYSRFGTIQEEAAKVPPTRQTGRGPPPSVPTKATDIHIPGLRGPLMNRIGVQPIASSGNVPGQFDLPGRPQLQFPHAARTGNVPGQFDMPDRPQLQLRDPASIGDVQSQLRNPGAYLKPEPRVKPEPRDDNDRGNIQYPSASSSAPQARSRSIKLEPRDDDQDNIKISPQDQFQSIKPEL
ncbi:hypothetical protein F4860DRAFT_172586 [Xylaria cubensis]|nr:hypothetical protein F4860DRAFT_172586 [Xylaria cubensis]